MRCGPAPSCSATWSSRCPTARPGPWPAGSALSASSWPAQPRRRRRRGDRVADRPPRHAYETPVFGIRAGRRASALRQLAADRCRDRLLPAVQGLRAAGAIPARPALPGRTPVPGQRDERLQGRLRAPTTRWPSAASRTWSARELSRLLDAIPPQDLAIQWDLAYETQDIEGVLAWTSRARGSASPGP